METGNLDKIRIKIMKILGPEQESEGWKQDCSKCSSQISKCPDIPANPESFNLFSSDRHAKNFSTILWFHYSQPVSSAFIHIPWS